MNVAGGKWDVRQIKFGLLRRVHHRAIGVSDSDGVGGWPLVDDMCRDRTKVRGAAAVGDRVSIGSRYDGGGTCRTNCS